MCVGGGGGIDEGGLVLNSGPPKSSLAVERLSHIPLAVAQTYTPSLLAPFLITF